MRLTSAGAAGTVTGSCHLLMVHGEPDVMEVFGRRLSEAGRETVTPERNQTYDLA